MGFPAGVDILGNGHVVDAAGGTVGSDQPLVVVGVLHEGAGGATLQVQEVHVDDGTAALVKVLGDAEPLDHDALGLGVLFLLDLLHGQRLGSHHDLLGDQVAADRPDLEAVGELDGRSFFVGDDVVLHHDGVRQVADDAALFEDVVPAGLGQIVEDGEVLGGLLVVLDTEHFGEVPVEVDPVGLGRAVAVGVSGLEFLGLDAGRQVRDPLIVGLGRVTGKVRLLVGVHQDVDDLLGLDRRLDEDDLARERLLDQRVDLDHGRHGQFAIGGAGLEAGGHAHVAVDGDHRLLFFGQLGDLLSHEYAPVLSFERFVVSLTSRIYIYLV